jgi:transketolase
MAYESDSNVHLGGALSIVDVVAVLYGAILKNMNPRLPYEKRDKFLLSKGHAALALYAALGEIGLIPEKELKTYLQDGSNLCAHPVMNPSIGIESSNGSLGQGISMAVGIALSAKRKKRDYQTYTIIGNGEADEGIVWEALACAVQFKLDNLTIILDDNKFQNDGASADIMSYPNYADRMKSFGFDVIEVDGNNITEVHQALLRDRIPDKPRIVIADTVKGKGISFMENDNSWHHNRLTLQQYKQAIAELDG